MMFCFPRVCVLLGLLQSVLAENTTGQIYVMVFGDSYGDTGPTYHQLQDSLDAHKAGATVRSAAIGGTGACQWAAKENGMSLVQKTKKLFPDLKDGPQYLWYTLGANDVWRNHKYQECQKKATTWDQLNTCIIGLKDDVLACTSKLLDNYFEAFPKSKVLQTGYDIPCYSVLCRHTVDKAFFTKFCGTNITCSNWMGRTYENMYLGDLIAKYPQPKYTALHFIGASQKAWKVPGADVGKPVMSKGSNCKWVTECVHPKYKSPSGLAWGDAFWDKYFSHELNMTETSILV